MTLTAQAFAQLDHSVRQLIPALNTMARLQRATLPQWFDAATLEQRWCIGRKALIALLEREVGYVGQRGIPLRVHLDDVLMVDEVLRIGREAAVELAKSEVA